MTFQSLRSRARNRPCLCLALGLEQPSGLALPAAPTVVAREEPRGVELDLHELDGALLVAVLLRGALALQLKLCLTQRLAPALTRA